MAHWLLIIQGFLLVPTLSKPLSKYKQADQKDTNLDIQWQQRRQFPNKDEPITPESSATVAQPHADLIPEMTIRLTRPTQAPSSFKKNKPRETAPPLPSQEAADTKLFPPIIASSPATITPGCTTTSINRHPAGGILPPPCHPVAESTVHTSTATWYQAVDCHGCDFVEVLQPMWGCPLEGVPSGTVTVSGVETVTSMVCGLRGTGVPMNVNSTRMVESPMYSVLHG